MAWEDPKTNWTQSSVPKANDFNRIEENIKTIKTGLGAASGYEVSDSSSASSIGAGTRLVTERDVYNGLPRINNGHSYSAANNFFAPTEGGPASSVLLSDGNKNPIWVSQADLNVGLVNGARVSAKHIIWAPGSDDSITSVAFDFNVTSAVVTSTVKSMYGAGPILEIGSISDSTVNVQVDNDAGDISGFYIIAVEDKKSNREEWH